jgi:surface protein
MKKIIATNKTLKRLIQEHIEKYGFNVDLNHIDVSSVKDMYGMFRGSQFNGDISQWDVSSVRDMAWMFENSQFNSDISQWNISAVTNMYGMFRDSQFNGDIGKWKISQETKIDENLKEYHHKCVERQNLINLSNQIPHFKKIVKAL